MAFGRPPEEMPKKKKDLVYQERSKRLVEPLRLPQASALLCQQGDSAGESVPLPPKRKGWS